MAEETAIRRRTYDCQKYSDRKRVKAKREFVVNTGPLNLPVAVNGTSDSE